MLRFFSDFDLVSFSNRPLSKTPSSFLYGREPKWDDLDQHVDIERNDNKKIEGLVEQEFEQLYNASSKIIIVTDDAGTGKTTAIRRAAHNQASKGRPILMLKTLSRIDVNVAIDCISRLAMPALIIVDSIADHIEQLVDLLDNDVVASKVVVLGSERSYRKRHIEVFLDDDERIDHELSILNTFEHKQLIERYREYGLVGVEEAIRNPSKFAKILKNDPVAVAICRILNDFSPLESIVDSLLRESSQEQLFAYLCVSLAQHCYSSGVKYSLLQSIVGQKMPLATMFDTSPLRIVINQEDYVVALNAIIGEQVLFKIAKRDSRMMMDAFKRIASSLAIYVNRDAIKRRSSEARLAQRLFDADQIVKPLLGGKSGEFYIESQSEWEWNSRYWEQRALLAVDYNLTLALQYARHAVAIEKHPFPLTTLGKVLLKMMESDLFNRKKYFDEAYKNLIDAIKKEDEFSRVSVHPYITLIGGVARYIELDGVLTNEQNVKMIALVRDAKVIFHGDRQIEALIERLSFAMRL